MKYAITNDILTAMIKHYQKVPCACGLCSAHVEPLTPLRRARNIMRTISSICPRCNNPNHVSR